MRRRSLSRVLLLAGLAMGAVAAFVTWYVYYVADPRLTELDVIPELAEPIVPQPGTERDVATLMSALAEIYLSRPSNAGIVIGVVIDGERHVVARGLASRRGSPRPVDSSSLFEIGSITKGLTGIALAQAVLRGDVALDDPISRYAPMSPPVPIAPPITLEDLATHSAGLPGTPPAIRPWRFLFPPNPYRTLSEEGLWRSLDLSWDGIPASRSYRYSNFGFMLLGRILQRATGRSYSQLVEQGIGEPLGMRSTYVSMTDAARLRLVDGHSLGHRMEHNVDYQLPGAEGVVSSLDDMLTLAEALMRPDDTPLAAAIQLATEQRRAAREGVAVGLGWHIREEPATARVIYHNGETLGFYSAIGAVPEKGIGVVVLANSRDQSVGRIGYNLLRVLLQ